MEKYNKYLLIFILLMMLLPEYLTCVLILPLIIIYLKNNKIKLTKLQIGELIFITILIISSIWSKNTIISFSISLFILILFLFQIIIFNRLNKNNFKKYLNIFILGISITSLIAILQYIFRFIPNPLFKDIDNFFYSLLPINIQVKQFAYRMSSTFSNPNLLSYVLVLSFPISLYLLFTNNIKKEPINLINVIIIIVGLLLTKTRISILCLFITIIISIFMVEKKYVKYYILFIITILLLSFHILIDRFDITNINDILKIFKGKSINTHIKIWKSCLDYIKNKPFNLIFGNGSSVETTYNILITYYNINQPHSHNFIIELLIQIGLIGISSMTYIIYLIIKLLRRIKNNKKLITYINILLSFIIIGITDFYFVTPKQIICLFFILGTLEYIVKDEEVSLH